MKAGELKVGDFFKQRGGLVRFMRVVSPDTEDSDVKGVYLDDIDPLDPSLRTRGEMGRFSADDEVESIMVEMREVLPGVSL